MDTAEAPDAGAEPGAMLALQAQINDLRELVDKLARTTRPALAEIERLNVVEQTQAIIVVILGQLYSSATHTDIAPLVAQLAKLVQPMKARHTTEAKRGSSS